MNEKKEKKTMEDVPRLQIEAVMSVSPLKVTEPRRIRRVLVSDDDDNTEIFGGCYRVVMYYENVKEEECGDAVVGWTVESLARALSENPLLAGRLRRREEEGEGEGGGRKGMEIVSNDSGIRMVEARISVSIAEFLEWSQKDDVEGELAFWKDIDEQCPEFSPLFYLQVTIFECGGYSIGISCSLLVSEIVMVEDFLKKWADIHSNIVPRNGQKITPIYYHPRLGNPASPPNNIISRSPHKNRGQTLIFKITAQDSHSEKELAMLCVNEAQKKLDRNMGSQFPLFVKESREVFKVENCCNTEDSRTKIETMSADRTTWDDIAEYEVEFQEGNRPVVVSRWIGCSSDGNVVAVPCPKQGVPVVIVVTIPSENATNK